MCPVFSTLSLRAISCQIILSNDSCVMLIKRYNYIFIDQIKIDVAKNV